MWISISAGMSVFAPRRFNFIDLPTAHSMAWRTGHAALKSRDASREACPLTTEHSARCSALQCKLDWIGDGIDESVVPKSPDRWRELLVLLEYITVYHQPEPILTMRQPRVSCEIEVSLFSISGGGCPWCWHWGWKSVVVLVTRI